MVCGLAHTHQGPQSRAPLVEHDAAKAGRARQRIDVHDLLGSHDIELHKIEQSRTTGEITDRRWRHIGDESFGVLELPVVEGTHYAFSIAALASRTAATMLGYAAQRQRLPLMNSRMVASEPALPTPMQATADMI